MRALTSRFSVVGLSGDGDGVAEGEVWLLVYYDNAEVLVVPYSVKVEPQMLDMRAAVEPYGTTVQLEPLDARIDA